MDKECLFLASKSPKFCPATGTFVLLSVPGFPLHRASKSSIHSKSSILQNLVWKEEEQGIFQNLLYKGKWTEITILCQSSEGFAKYPKDASVFEVSHDYLILRKFITLREAKEFAENYFNTQVKQGNYSTKKKSWLLCPDGRSRIATWQSGGKQSKLHGERYACQ